jgi:hypothetical protein
MVLKLSNSMFSNKLTVQDRVCGRETVGSALTVLFDPTTG